MEVDHVRDWAEVLSCTIQIYMSDLQVKVMDFEKKNYVKVFVKVFRSLYLLV